MREVISRRFRWLMRENPQVHNTVCGFKNLELQTFADVMEYLPKLSDNMLLFYFESLVAAIKKCVN